MGYVLLEPLVGMTEDQWNAKIEEFQKIYDIDDKDSYDKILGFYEQLMVKKWFAQSHKEALSHSLNIRDNLSFFEKRDNIQIGKHLSSINAVHRNAINKF